MTAKLHVIRTQFPNFFMSISWRSTWNTFPMQMTNLIGFTWSKQFLLSYEKLTDLFTLYSLYCVFLTSLQPIALKPTSFYIWNCWHMGKNEYIHCSSLLTLPIFILPNPPLKLILQVAILFGFYKGRNLKSSHQFHFGKSSACTGGWWTNFQCVQFNTGPAMWIYNPLSSFTSLK